MPDASSVDFLPARFGKLMHIKVRLFECWGLIVREMHEIHTDFHNFVMAEQVPAPGLNMKGKVKQWPWRDVSHATVCTYFLPGSKHSEDKRDAAVCELTWTRNGIKTYITTTSITRWPMTCYPACLFSNIYNDILLVTCDIMKDKVCYVCMCWGQTKPPKATRHIT